MDSIMKITMTVSTSRDIVENVNNIHEASRRCRYNTSTINFVLQLYCTALPIVESSTMPFVYEEVLQDEDYLSYCGICFSMMRTCIKSVSSEIWFF